MSAVSAILLTALLTVAIGLVAIERAHAYGLGLHVFERRPGTVLVLALIARCFIAMHGSSSLSASAVLAVAAVAGITDMQTGYVFDRVLLVAAMVLVPAAWADGRMPGAWAGGAIDGGLMAALFVVTGRRAIGLGDIKLAAVLGFGLGSTVAVHALIYSFVSGGIFGSALLLLRRARRGAEIRFAPFLALGTTCALMEASW